MPRFWEARHNSRMTDIVKGIGRRPGVGRGREARRRPIAANARTRGQRVRRYGGFGNPVPAEELRHPCERGLNGDVDERSWTLNA